VFGSNARLAILEEIAHAHNDEKCAADGTENVSAPVVLGFLLLCRRLRVDERGAVEPDLAV
jgi:hypothetical protein